MSEKTGDMIHPAKMGSPMDSLLISLQDQFKSFEKNNTRLRSISAKLEEYPSPEPSESESKNAAIFRPGLLHGFENFIELIRSCNAEYNDTLNRIEKLL